MGHTKKTHNKSQWKNYNYICYEFFSLHWHAVREGKGKTWRISIFQKNKSQKIWIRFFPERMPTTWSSCSQRQQKIQQRKQHYFLITEKNSSWGKRSCQRVNQAWDKPGRHGFWSQEKFPNLVLRNLKPKKYSTTRLSNRYRSNRTRR